MKDERTVLCFKFDTNCELEVVLRAGREKETNKGWL